VSTTAKNTLKTARFKGNSAQFSFEKYIQKHIEAHEILRSPEINEPESEKNKVGYFLDGISDSRLTVSICVVESNPIYLNDFNACHAFLSSVLCKAQQRAKTTEHQGRNVSSTSTTKSKSAYKGKGGGGKGRDNGKKKRGGHGYITPEDWKKLSEDEKQKIRDDRTKSRKTSLWSRPTTTKMRPRQQIRQLPQTKLVNSLVSRLTKVTSDWQAASRTCRWSEA